MMIKEKVRRRSILMKTKTIYLLLGSILMIPVVQAESVKSGSKYPIVVEIYKGSNVTCNPRDNEITSSVKGIAQTYKNAKGNMLGKLKSAISQTINSTMRGSGCDLVGQAVALEPEGTINVPVGAFIVAYKDPFEAWTGYKKVVNPLPAICKVQAGKTIRLETRKSETLRGFFGLAGDGGLKCTM